MITAGGIGYQYGQQGNPRDSGYSDPFAEESFSYRQISPPEASDPAQTTLPEPPQENEMRLRGGPTPETPASLQNTIEQGFDEEIIRDRLSRLIELVENSDEPAREELLLLLRTLVQELGVDLPEQQRER